MKVLCLSLALLLANCVRAIGAGGEDLTIRPVQISSCDALPQGFACTPMNYKPGFEISYLVEGKNIVAFDSLAIDSITTPEGVDISRYKSGLPTYTVGPFPKAADDGKSCLFSLDVNENRFGKVESLVIKGQATVLLATRREEKTVELKAGDKLERKAGPYSIKIGPPGVGMALFGNLFGSAPGAAPGPPVSTPAAPPPDDKGPFGVTISGPLNGLIQAKFKDGDEEVNSGYSGDEKGRTFAMPKPKSGKIVLTLSYWTDLKTKKVFIGHGDEKNSSEKQITDNHRAETSKEAVVDAADDIRAKETARVRAVGELKRLQNRWTVVRVEKGRQANWTDADRFDFAAWGELEMQPLRIDSRGNSIKYRYRIDPTANPKTIDLYYESGEGAKAAIVPIKLGIYEFDGERLKVCFADYLPCLHIEQRPRAFTVDPASADALFTLNLCHESAEQLAIQGQWEVVSRVDDGRRATEADVRGKVIEFKDHNAYFLRTAAGEWSEDSMYFALEPNAHPSRIYMNVRNGDIGVDYVGDRKGIYKIEGDRLTIAYREVVTRQKSYDPPVRFESAQGSNATLIVLRKKVENPSPAKSSDNCNPADIVSLQGGAAKTESEQAKAIAAIKKLDGRIILDEKSPDRPVIGVELDGRGATDADLQHIASLTQLRSLNLWSSGVTNVGLKHVKRLKSLQVLNLDDTKVTDAGLKDLAELPNLQSLDLTYTKVSDAGMEHLKRMVELRSLGLEGTGVTDAGLRQLTALPQLQELDLTDTRVTDAGLRDLKGLTELRKLCLYQTRVSNAGLAHLAPFAKLEVLALPDNVADAGLAHIARLTKLQILLHGRDTQVTDAGLKYISALKELRVLDLDHTKVTDEGLVNLKNLTELQDLSLEYTQVTGAGLKHLQGMAKLEKLDLELSKVSDRGLENLNGLKSLRQLNLEYTYATSAGADKLRHALPNCSISGAWR